MRIFGWLDDFAEFALRGNVIDMAVGFTVGAAFTTLVKSLVDNVIMPPIGYITSGIDFSNRKILLKEAQPAIEANAATGVEARAATEAVYLTYGQFINSCLTFVIVALAVFFIVRIANRAQKAVMEEDKPATEEAAKVPEDIQLLREIRDQLRGGSQVT